MKLPIQKILIALFLFGSHSGMVPAQTVPDITPLLIGKPIERELKGGEKHSYQFTAKSGEYIRFVVEQRGIDVTLTLIGPGGERIAEADNLNGILFPETLTTIVEITGIYRLDINSRHQAALKGSYEVELQEQRSSIAKDKTYVLAEQALERANYLRLEGTVESLKEALEKFEAADRLYKEIADKSENAGFSLMGQGIILDRLGDKPKALQSYERALEFFKANNHKKLETTTLVNIGAVYSSMRVYDKALEFYDLALLLSKQVGNVSAESTILNNIGSIYASTGKNQEALEIYQKSLELIRKVDDKPREATTLNNIGNILNLRGEKQMALDNFNQALSIFKSVGDKSKEALALTNIGTVYGSIGDNKKAIEYYDLALHLKRVVGDKNGEAATLNNIATQYSLLGEIKKALEFYDLALQLVKQTGERLGEGHILRNIGEAHSFLGENQKALEYYTKALALRRTIGDKQGEAVSLNDIGLAHRLLGEKEKALESYALALPITRQVGNKGLEASTLNNIGLVYFVSGDHQKAIEYYSPALEISSSVNDKVGTARTLSNLGSAYDSLGDKRKALEYLYRSLPILREVSDKRGEAAALGRLMLAWKSLKNPRLVILYGKLSVGLRQQLRVNIKGLEREVQGTYLKTVEPSYRIVSETLIVEGRLEEAFQILNLFKDQQFFDFDQTHTKSPVPVTLTSREADFVSRYEEKIGRVKEAEQKFRDRKQRISNITNDSEKIQLQQSEVDIKTASDEFFNFLKHAETEFSLPDLEKDKVAKIADTKEMQNALAGIESKTKEKAAVLYTLIGENTFRVLLITSSGITSVSSPVKGKELSRKAAEFADRLRQTDPLTKIPIISQEELKKEGKDLYDIVFAPAALKLKELKIEPGVLMWSLDGPLRYLPVGALYDGKKYLAERYGNTVFTRADAGRIQSPVSLKWNGSGFYTSNEYVLPTQDEMRRFPALKNAKNELETIFGSPSKRGIVTGKFIANKDFTREEFVNRLRSREPLIHIASHFEFVPGDADSSFLLLGDGSKLTLEELKKLPDDLFNGVELLTLSACESGLQRERKSDGREIDSFAELAQRKGAKAVLASLWKVDDESTSQLMSRFYEVRESKNLTKAEALLRAQLTLIKSNEFSHPYYWAPFILIGNWR